MAQPLKKVSKEGKVYTRPAAVEANIDRSFGQSHATIAKQAQELDEKSSDYIASESLVHLIRDAMRRGDQQLQNTLLPILLTRCEAILKSKIPDGVPFADQVREDILGEFALLFVEDVSANSTGVLDYYECRFNDAFRKFRITQHRRDKVHTSQMIELLDGSEDPDESRDGKGELVPGIRPMHDDRLILGETLSVLTEDQRTAVVLHHILGYEIESKDPEKTTVATRCKVTGRTIRTHLSKAYEQLSKIEQEKI